MNNVLLGSLGTVAFILIIVAGFRWMTSGGNEETIAGARRTIAAAVVGLIVVFVAYAITVFVFDVLQSAT